MIVAGVGCRREASADEIEKVVRLALGTFNQEIASDVVGEAIDLLDQGQPVLARALLMALRARIVGSPRAPGAVAKRRWGA